MATRNEFFVALLRAINAPVTAENLIFLAAWSQAENTRAAYNPFATTQAWAGATNFNSVPVRNYATFEDGVAATARTIQNGRYNDIVQGLKGNAGAENIARSASLNVWGSGQAHVAQLVPSARNGYTNIAQAQLGTQATAGGGGVSTLPAGVEPAPTGGTSPDGTVAGVGTTTAAANPTVLPAGGRLGRVDGTLVVMYDLPSGGIFYFDFSAPGAEQAFQWQQLGEVQNFTAEQFYGQQGLVHGGMVAELVDSETNGMPFGQWVEDQILILLGGNTSAGQNPEIKLLMLSAVANEWSDEEIQARIRQTTYWQQMTDGQRTWSGLSPAEQAVRQENQSAALAQAYFDLTGQTIAMDDRTLLSWSQRVASGVISAQAAIEQWIKPTALGIENSPWLRTLEKAKEDALQEGVDVENSAHQMMEQARQWGVPLTIEQAKSWAQAVNDNELTDADIETAFDQQARVLYGDTRPPGMRTDLWAQPWMQEYSRVLETGAPDLQSNDIQKALRGTNGQSMTLFEFNQHLKSTRKDEYLATKGARDEFTQVGASLGSLFGFTK
jgi:hypothetical protein